MLENKAEIVAGVSPGRYGQEVMGVTVYDKISEAVKRHEIEVSVIFVPRNAVFNAVTEAIEANIPLIIIITSDIPVTETIKLKNIAQQKNITIIGPGSAGVYVPGETKAGTISNEYIIQGDIGVVTRTAGNEKRICQSLYKEEIGESMVVSLGGMDVTGTGYVEILKDFEKDDNTEVVVIGGEAKGRLEEDAARFIMESKYSKPVIAYIFNRDSNPEIAIEKEKLFREAGVTVVDDIWEIGQIIKESTMDESE
jgi:succinyl-CoA synthetase alpha subunit